MKKIFLTYTLMVLSLSILSGQRSSISTMHMLNPYQNVQAYGGFDRSLSSTMMYRSQWAPIASNPRYLHFNVHLPVYFLNGGAGVILEQESLGVESNSTAKLSYNIVFSGSFGLISGGISAGITQKSLFSDDIITPTGEYGPGVINHNDPIFGNGQSSAFRPTYGLSAVWKLNNLTTGIQIDDFFAPAFQFDGVRYDGRAITSLIADYQYQLTDEITLQPSALVLTNLNLWQFHVGVLCNYGNIFGGINMRGFSQNTIESVGILTGIRFNKHYTIAYSYDLGVSALKNSSEGSHELVLKYNLNKIINTGLPPRIIYNPRDL